MKAFVDTSVLVASFWGDHPDHERSARLYRALSKPHAFCAAHSVAEVFSVMTRLPVRPMIPPEQALLFTEDLHERFVTVALDGEEYYEVIRRLAERGLKGGIVYDALILHCASKSKADVIYTWNVEHFCRIAPEFQARIRTP